MVESGTRRTLHIRLPYLEPIKHEPLSPNEIVSHRHSPGAFQALPENLLESEIDRLVDFQQRHRGQHHRFESGPDERVEHKLTDSGPNSPKPGPKDQRNTQYIAVRVRLRTRWVSVARKNSLMTPASPRLVDIRALTGHLKSSHCRLAPSIVS